MESVFVHDIEKAITQELNIAPTLAALLVARGIDTPAFAQEFLYPKYSNMHSPNLFADMQKCVDILKHTLATGGKIAIYGDYDCDGVSGASILYSYLYTKTKNLSLIFSDRIEDGYGFSMNKLSELTGVSLLILVDCGITSTLEIAAANELGVCVLVLDHHECPSVLPPAYAIVNPKLPGSAYPYAHLCGAGLAFKFICALESNYFAANYIDIAALGTIGDIVPLTGENRIIASIGLSKMRKKPSEGILELCKVSNIDHSKMTARQVAFSLSPRINAASRMDSAYNAARVLCNFAPKKYAQVLQTLNTARQAEADRITKAAKKSMGEGENFIFAYGDFNPGVIGIVASRLCEEYVKPAFIFARNKENYVGSVRSVGNFNVYNALSAHNGLYLKFGGHAQAAGLTLCEDHLHTLRDLLREGLADAVYEKPIHYDVVVKLVSITEELIEQLALLEPTGHKNPPPVFMAKGVQLKDPSLFGKEKKVHLMGTLCDETGQLPAILYQFGTDVEQLPRRFDCIFTAEINTYTSAPQANIVKIL